MMRNLKKIFFGKKTQRCIHEIKNHSDWICLCEEIKEGKGEEFFFVKQENDEIK